MTNKEIKQRTTALKGNGVFPWHGEKCFHVAVVGTMSSGKSTLIDALLGTDCMPSANLACTAKIISVCRRGDMKTIVGFTVSKDERMSMPEQATRKQINDWNQDEKVQRIVLYGKAMRGRPKIPLVVFHDTPGTNDAKHPVHLEQVLTFLQQNPMDMILFVIDGKYSGTDSQQKLAIKIRENITGDVNANILFLFNKLNCYDLETEKEDIEKDLQDARRDMESAGYIKPIVLPVSAKAARLFHAFLMGWKLSKQEETDYEILSQSFGAKGWNLPIYFPSNLNRNPKKSRLLALGKDSNGINLRAAIQRTGLPALQDILNQIIIQRGR